MAKETSSKLARGVVFLTTANLIVKAAGLLFKIPLTAMIGEEGMGYYSGAYTLFTWLYMLFAAGLPAASATLIPRLPAARRSSGAMRIFGVSMAIFVPLGLLGSALLIFGAGPISYLMKIERSRLAIIAIAPTLFFICQSAALRGYFQGFGEFGWNALSQIAEAIGKAALGVALAHRALARGASIPEAAAWAAVGITAGVGAGMLVLYLAMLFTKRCRGEKSQALPDITPRRTIASRLLSAAMPIALSSSVMSLTGLIDTLLMTRCLHAAGLSQAETAALYGNYTALAVPMFNLPPVLTASAAAALLPALTEALAAGDAARAKRLTSAAASLTMALAIPASIGMAALAEPILALFFAPEVAARGAGALTLLAPSSAMLCMIGLTNTILQASGHARVPLYAMLAGAAVKLTATWLLTPHLLQYAAPISTGACYFTVLAISLAAIAAKTELCGAMGLRAAMRPMVPAAIAVSAAVMLRPLIGGRIGTLAAIAAACAVYAALTAMCSPEVLRMIKGKRGT